MENNTCGVVFIHSVSSAMRPHVEWALSGVLGVPTNLHWLDQPALPGSYRSEYEWCGPAGTGAKLASRLKTCKEILFEVTENPTAGFEGERYSFTPSLGVFHANTGQTGDIYIHENQLSTALYRAACGETTLENEVARLLGQPWDDELEIYRQASSDTPVRWLHAVG